LNTKDRIHLTAASTVTNQFKHKLIFIERVLLKQIENLPFFDNFKNVVARCTDRKFPKNSKRLVMICCRDCTHCDLIMLSPDLQNINHLTLRQCAGYPEHRFFCEQLMSTECYVFSRIKIPNSVTCVNFDGVYNQSVPKIPNSVTHLTFGYFFDKPIKGTIPNSVTHLVFGDKFNKPTKDYIPYSVTHLKLGESFDHFAEDFIPDSVTHLSTGRQFYEFQKIPTSVIYIKIKGWEQYYPTKKVILNTLYGSNVVRPKK